MDISPEARTRLDEYLESRRLDLGLTWREVAERAGISYEALRALRTGPGGTSARTLRKVDAALQLEPGSIQRVLAGGDAVPAQEPQYRPSPASAASDLPDDDPVLVYVRSLPGLTPQEREALESVARSRGIDVALRQGMVGFVLTMWAQQAQERDRSA